MSAPPELRLRAACARARALVDEYEACAAGAGGDRGSCPTHELEELRTRIDAELRHAGRAAGDLAEARAASTTVRPLPRRAA